MSSALALFEPRPVSENDPSALAWPATLPIELALKVDTVEAICASYGIDADHWNVLRKNKVFIAELGRAIESLRVEGMAFKARSQLQSIELLKESWKLIHDPLTPHNVRADLIKSTIRWAGLDASKDSAVVGGGGVKAAFQININFGG